MSKIAKTRPKLRIFHGLSRHHLYPTWKRMLSRCYTPSTSHFGVYGGRGIRVAESWMDFRAFLADMGPTHRPGLSLDRRNTNGHYTPENCRWADGATQSANRRGVRTVEHHASMELLVHAARKSGLHPETVALRIKKGESVDSALSRGASTNPAPRAVIIDGKHYPSLSAAARSLGITREAIFGRIKRGKANYDD